jgi:hypothetical protein
MAKKMDCFKAGIAVTHLIGKLFEASEAVGNNRKMTGRSLLADAALSARDLAKIGTGKLKKTAEKISQEAAKLSRTKDLTVQQISELRMKARKVKTQAIITCRSSY